MTGNFKDKRPMVTIGKFMIVLAVLWAIGMSVYLFFTPITVDEITAVALPNDSSSVEHATIQQSWYQVQGLWGSFVLVLVAGFYILGTYLASRKLYGLLGVMCVIAILFSYVAGLSIGLLYLPSALCLTVGTVLLWLSRERG